MHSLTKHEDIVSFWNLLLARLHIV